MSEAWKVENRVKDWSKVRYSQNLPIDFETSQIAPAVVVVPYGTLVRQYLYSKRIQEGQGGIN